MQRLGSRESSRSCGQEMKSDAPVSAAIQRYHASRLRLAKERSRVDLRPDPQTSLRRSAKGSLPRTRPPATQRRSPPRSCSPIKSSRKSKHRKPVAQYDDACPKTSRRSPSRGLEPARTPRSRYGEERVNGFSGGSGRVTPPTSTSRCEWASRPAVRVRVAGWYLYARRVTGDFDHEDGVVLCYRDELIDAGHCFTNRC